MVLCAWPAPLVSPPRPLLSGPRREERTARSARTMAKPGRPIPPFKNRRRNVRRRRSGSGGTPASSFPARPPPLSTGREREKTVEERTLRGKVTGLPSEKNGKTGGSSRRPCLTHCPSPSRPPARGASGTIYHKNPDCPGSATVAAPTCVPQKRASPLRARRTQRSDGSTGVVILRLRR